MRTLTLTMSLFSLAASAPAQVTLYATDFDTIDGWTITSGCTNNNNNVRWDARHFPAHYGVPAPSPARALGYTGIQGWWPSSHWCGEALSPPIDLTALGWARLEFQYFWDHESGCDWDAFGVDVRSAATGAVLFTECLSATGVGGLAWAAGSVPLDPAWGVVQVVFTQDTIDTWNGWETGCWVDDMAVIGLDCSPTTQCVGAPQMSGAPGAALRAEGSTSLLANDLRIVGAGFPLHTFAAAFAGPDSATIPVGNGVRCVGAGTSARLAVAPTRDQGTPLWSLDLGAAPLAQMAVVGQPLYVQTIYRDGAAMNLSDALRVPICP